MTEHAIQSLEPRSSFPKPPDLPPDPRFWLCAYADLVAEHERFRRAGVKDDETVKLTVWQWLRFCSATDSNEERRKSVVEFCQRHEGADAGMPWGECRTVLALLAEWCCAVPVVSVCKRIGVGMPWGTGNYLPHDAGTYSELRKNLVDMGGEIVDAKLPPAVPDVQEPDTSSGQKAQQTPERMTLLKKSHIAVTLRANHPDWTDKTIAETVGVNRTTLYRWPEFRMANALAKGGKARFPYGRKDKDTREVEASENPMRQRARHRE